MPTFGTRTNGCPYIERPSAYAIVRNASACVALVRTPKGAYLPGGGIEAGETPEQAICREGIEEAGLILAPRSQLGRAIEIVYSAEENTCFEKQCVFIEADVVGQTASHESDHQLIWVDLDQAIRILSPESHRWILQSYSRHPSGNSSAAPE